MKPQPFKKALAHLVQAESFQDRLGAHLKEVRIILERAEKEYKPVNKSKSLTQVKIKKKRTI